MKFTQVPIYLITTLPKKEAETTIKESKADGYILKLFEFEDFGMILNLLHNFNTG